MQAATDLIAPDSGASAANVQHWIRICRLDDIPALGARVLQIAGADPIALFRTDGDRVFALVDRCPHKGGPLSQGIVAGDSVTCPLHNWNIALDSGQACAPDVGCARRFPVRVDDGEVWLSLRGAA
ncbi:nitrite reductase small subunit NirD [Xanthomonas sp. AM6]|uniref:nitrite reductase small subunit NirD n=1 Tax=Xanthomonas sp. AM6 TaxID=2982531 RepID=UPI0021DB639F|nr:nitrite reductase small subunit NirD [Xanthomonas sp. AM6]UYB52999.1 nitrite reductase small subunit NirD [Xanthomonas sp. AM6]